MGTGRWYEEAIAQNAVLQRQLAEAREEIASVRSANAYAPHNLLKLLNIFVFLIADLVCVVSGTCCRR